MLAHKIKLTCDNTKIDALYVPAFGFAYCMINNGTTTFRKYNQEDMPDSLREDFLEISMGNIPKRNYQSRDHRRVSVDDPHIGALESEIKWLKEGIAQSDERIV